jgi:hypothetical protein
MNKTRFAYDTEFIEDGRTIDLISIGIIREDGQEYYAVNSEMPFSRIREHRWLMENVFPFLLMKSTVAPDGEQLLLLPDLPHPSVKPKKIIAKEVYEFLTSGEHDPEIWAYYGSYDHVVFAQLWGVMAQLPNPMPMRTRDVADLLDEYDAWDGRPLQDSATAHNALADARNVMEILQYIRRVAQPQWILGEAMKLQDRGLLT